MFGLFVRLYSAPVFVSFLDSSVSGISEWGYNSYGQATNEKSTYIWHPSPFGWRVGEVRQLAAEGGHLAVLTDACSLKELCGFRLADSDDFSIWWLPILVYVG